MKTPANMNASLGNRIFGNKRLSESVTPGNIVWGVLWVALALFPLVVESPYLRAFGVSLVISMVGISGFNIIFSFTGQVSMFHGALYGVGSYACGIAAVTLGWNVWISMLTGAIVAGLLGLVVGIPSLRAKGPYFGIGTLAFAIIITILIQKMEWLTKGVRCLTGIPAPDPITLPLLGTIDFAEKVSVYYLALITLVITLFFTRRLINSLIGRSFIAVCQQNEVLVSSLGINPWRTKVISFVISSVVTGFAGSLFAIYFGNLSPDVSNYMVGVMYLLKVMLGGIGTMIGPIIGTVILGIIGESLQAVVHVRTFLMGLILVLVLVFMPNGLAGTITTLWDSWKIRQAQRSNAKGSETTPGGAYE